MPGVLYSRLSPTNDFVSNDASMFYPDSNISETFGTIMVPKIYGYKLDALEIASSGKIAYTLNDLHSLDVALTSDGAVDVRARNSNALEMANEPKTALLRLNNDGTVVLTGLSNVLLRDAHNTVTMSAAGVAVAAATGSETHAVPSGQAYAFSVGPKVAARLDGALFTLSNNMLVGGNSEFEGPALVVPRGDTAGRPPAPKNGSVYYNTQTRRFEGFAADVWNGMGGVMDFDQNTYVSAEEYPGSNDDNIRFVNAGVESMRLIPNGFLGVGTSNPAYKMDVAGESRFRNEVKLHTGGNTKQVTPKLFVAGVEPVTGSLAVVDGPSTNDRSGLSVTGLPPGVAANTTHGDRFAKALTWNNGTDGMKPLGSHDGVASEAFWEMQGGAFHLSHINANTGGKVSFVLRVNEFDQLEMVKRTLGAGAALPTYTTVAFFGTMTQGVSADAGYAKLDPLNSLLNTAVSPYAVTAAVTTFQAYSAYTVYAALYPAASQPTSLDVVAVVGAGNGFLSATLPAGADNAAAIVFVKMASGASIANAPTKIAIVLCVGTTLSSSPYMASIIV